LKEIKSKPYNVDCISKKPANDMMISKAITIDPIPPDPVDPYVKHSELKTILNEELSKVPA
jgi:hypothetical protein